MGCGLLDGGEYGDEEDELLFTLLDVLVDEEEKLLDVSVSSAVAAAREEVCMGDMGESGMNPPLPLDPPFDMFSTNCGCCTIGGVLLFLSKLELLLDARVTGVLIIFFILLLLTE